MKNSKKYSQKLQKLYRSLKRKYPKVQKVVYEEPTEALIYAVVSENTTESAAQSTMKRIAHNFVDFNDLRVSLTEEVVEALGSDTSSARKTAGILTRILRSVFYQRDTISLKGLKKMGKRPAKQALEKTDAITSFVVDYCMLTALGGHAIPLTPKMIRYLKDNELVYEEADYRETGGFLARQILAEDAYEFYALLRQESEASKTRRKKTAAAKTKTTKKKAKKTTKKTKKKKG